jgi:hypothetical protein
LVISLGITRLEFSLTSACTLSVMFMKAV